eukprot:GILI01009353.1.p1 GENE.GILI01009353.1~~GILI01009353.1.p1  ORF type:complete len:184 (-),score=46.52 GILI01009353.1:97-648(-)
MRTVLLTTAAASIVALFLMGGTVDARPSCEHCLSTGQPYFCKASITSQICFNKAGDAQCDHEFCVCCKMEPMGGCMACEELDEDEWQEENLEQIDAWQSHQLRARIEQEKEEAAASRNEQIGIKSGLTFDKLAKKREEKAAELEKEKIKYAGMKKDAPADTPKVEIIQNNGDKETIKGENVDL